MPSIVSRKALQTLQHIRMHARFNLARSMRVKLESLQKVENESARDIRNEVVSAVLHGIEVVHPCRDLIRSLYYLLVRMISKY